MHVERLLRAGDVRTLYFATNYDLNGTPIPACATKVSLLGGIRMLIKSDADVLEILSPYGYANCRALWF